MHTGLDPNWQGTEQSVCVFVITKHLCIYTYVDDCLAVKTFSPGFVSFFLKGPRVDMLIFVVHTVTTLLNSVGGTSHDNHR